jgi:hypothetical protein
MAALAQQWQRLTSAAVGSLVQAVLAAVSDPDNIAVNRAFLLAQLIPFANGADEGLRRDVFAVVEPMAVRPGTSALEP